MAENVAIFWQIITHSSNISPAFAKKKSKKNKDNFVEIEYEVHNLT